jgi:mono/diheme cytochrome c family protein
MTRSWLLVSMALLLAATQSRAADPPPGFYTSGQAQQGRALYGANCAACHGASLQGGAGDAGPLSFEIVDGTGRTYRLQADLAHLR